MGNTILNVDEFNSFILRTKNADYTLNLNELIADYGVVRVLDSDGVRINDGDTVYGRSDGKAWHVAGVFSGDYPVWAVDDNWNTRELKPEWLTHEEPESDTFEKIEEDAELSAKDYCIKWFGSFNSSAEMKKSNHIIMRCKKLYNDSVKQLNADFDWEAFKDGEIVVHCKTKELAIDFLESAEEHLPTMGYSVSSKAPYWKEYKDETCYMYNNPWPRICYASYLYCKECNYTIVEWEN